jgi:hypothetical protein
MNIALDSNPSIERNCAHGNNVIVEPAAFQSVSEMEQRVCTCFECSSASHLILPENVF